MTREEVKRSLMYTAYQMEIYIEEARKNKKYGFIDLYEDYKKSILLFKPLLEELIAEYETHERRDIWINALEKINQFLKEAGE